MNRIIICKHCKEEAKHQGFGLCSKCYHQDYKRRYPKRVKRSQEIWYENNKEALKERRVVYENTPERKNRKAQLGKIRRPFIIFNGNRLLTLIRDDFQCKICESTKRLNVHHIDEDSLNHDLDNLITLCMLCHRKLHRKYRPLKIPLSVIYDTFHDTRAREYLNGEVAQSVERETENLPDD